MSPWLLNWKIRENKGRLDSIPNMNECLSTPTKGIGLLPTFKGGHFLNLHYNWVDYNG